METLLKITLKSLYQGVYLFCFNVNNDKICELINFFLVFSETGDDPAVHGAQMEDRFYNNKSFQVSFHFKYL